MNSLMPSRYVLSIVLVLMAASAFGMAGGEGDAGPPRVALCIGVGGYGTEGRELPSAPRDAEALAAYLGSRQGFSEVTLFADSDASRARTPTREAVIERLEQIREASIEQPIGDLVFFFSGHGLTSTSLGGESYLLLGDTRLSMQKDVLPVLRKIRCRVMFILLDSCRAETPGGLIGKPGSHRTGIGRLDLSRDNSQVSETVFVVYASTQGTPSVTIPGVGGVFTQALLDGMSIYNNYYDIFVYLDRTVPLRSFARPPGDSGETRVQYVDFGGDFDSLRERGYPSFVDLSGMHAIVRDISSPDSEVIRSIDRRLTARQLSKRIGTITFSVGAGLCAAGAANLAMISTFDAYFPDDTAIERARSISWSVLGASFLVMIPSAVLAFLGV